MLRPTGIKSWWGLQLKQFDDAFLGKSWTIFIFRVIRTHAKKSLELRNPKGGVRSRGGAGNTSR